MEPSSVDNSRWTHLPFPPVLGARLYWQQSPLTFKGYQLADKTDMRYLITSVIKAAGRNGGDLTAKWDSHLSGCSREDSVESDIWSEVWRMNKAAWGRALAENLTEKGTDSIMVRKIWALWRTGRNLVDKRVWGAVRPGEKGKSTPDKLWRLEEGYCVWQCRSLAGSKQWRDVVKSVLMKNYWSRA